MPAPLTNCSYNKIKLLHDLSGLLWFIENYGLKDAKSEKDAECEKFMKFMIKDLTEHIDDLQKMLGSSINKATKTKTK